MPEYMVLFREDPAAFASMSPTEMQAVLQRYMAWFAQLNATGQMRFGKKLKDEGGRHLRRRGSEMLASEGPYAEAKDVVSGAFVIAATSYEDAQALLRDCPHLEFGWIEVREIDAAG